MKENVKGLILRGMKMYERPEREVLETVAKHIKNGGVTLYYENSKPVAFAIILWPADALEKPQVAHFYNEGSRKAAIRLRDHILDKVRQKGYNSFLAVNSSGAPDEVWQRAFQNKDWEINAVKTVFEFKVRQ